MSSQESQSETDTLNAYERVVRNEEKVTEKPMRTSQAIEDELSDLYRQHSHQQSMEGG